MTNLELKSIKVKTRIEKSKRSLKKDRHEAAHAQKQSQSFAPTPVDSLVPTGVSKISTLNGVLTGTYYVRDASGNVMAAYDYNKTSWSSIPTVTDYSIYGSSRVGTATGYASFIKGVSVYSRIRKNKNYELSNHLGNVIAVVSDKRQPHTSNGTTIDYYDPTILSTQDYYAFGAPMPGRGFVPSTSTYRYGFNGKEKDGEVKGEGNSYDYGMRIYDPRIARFLSIDPLTSKFVFYTPYQYAGNKPIVAIDMDGLEDVWTNKSISADGYTNKQVLYKEEELYEATRAAWAKKMGVDVALLPKTGSLTTKVTYGENGKPTNIQYSYSPTVQVVAHKDNFVVRIFKGLEGVMEKGKGKTTSEWEGQKGFDAYVNAVDGAGDVMEQAAPLFGPLAPVVQGAGEVVGGMADLMNTCADIEQKGLKVGLENGVIRGVSTVVGGQIDKVFDTSGLPNTGANEALNDGMDAVKGIIKMANEKAKDAATDANSSSNNN